jgi:hypothetical protein
MYVSEASNYIIVYHVPDCEPNLTIRFFFAGLDTSQFVKTTYNIREKYAGLSAVYPIIIGYALPLPLWACVQNLHICYCLICLF